MKAIPIAVALLAPARSRPADTLFALEDSPEDQAETTLEDRIAKQRKQTVARLEAKGNPYYQSIYESLKGTKPEPSLVPC